MVALPVVVVHEVLDLGHQVADVAEDAGASFLIAESVASRDRHNAGCAELPRISSVCLRVVAGWRWCRWTTSRSPSAEPWLREDARLVGHLVLYFDSTDGDRFTFARR